jgi:hypothetical protein
MAGVYRGGQPSYTGPAIVGIIDLELKSERFLRGASRAFRIAVFHERGGEKSNDDRRLDEVGKLGY